MSASCSVLFLIAALSPRPPNGSNHQDFALWEESRRDVSSDDNMLPGLLDTLRCRLHDGGIRQEEHGLAHSGHHPIILCQVEHGVQPPHLRLYEQKGL